MLCFLCGKRIGFLRALVDKQYCSADHRKEARLASAQAIREEEENETYVVARARKNKEKEQLRKNPSAGQAASILAFITVGGLLLAALLIPGATGGNRQGSLPGVSLESSVQKGFFSQLAESVGSLVRSSGPVTLEQNFKGGLGQAVGSMKDWVTVQASNLDDPRDWGSPGNHLASLRLWDRSTSLHNYQMDFQGRMEKNSLQWAIRAADGSNYYATKLLMTRPAPQINAAIQRYSMVDGSPSESLQQPVFALLERDKPYRVSVTVQDSTFTTYLNGQRISRFTDDQLAKGGIGFFDDPNDPQEIDWVTVSERDSFLGRMLSHFSLILTPHQRLR